MLPEVTILLDVQDIDNEIIKLNAQLAKYPGIWDEVKKKVAEKKEAHEKAMRDSDRHQRERRRVEQKIRMFSDDLRENQARQATVKTSKEYEAINKQIETLKGKLTQLEEQGIDLIEKEPEVAKAIEATKLEAEKADELYKQEKERIRTQFNEKKATIASLEKSKKTRLAKTSQKARDIYTRLMHQHPGSAAVPVRSGSCTGCHFGLLPDHLVQLHQSERIVFCPNCGRILSHDEDFVPEEHASAT